ncbi:MAG: hypothetical protein ACE5SW_12435 [Nitrososphaeraceae archaeon]
MALFHKNKSSMGSRKKLGSLAECWAGIGIWIGIWAVTFGIIASGILIR